jgi:RNA polymerase sigma-70 factor, ECF subfamily
VPRPAAALVGLRSGTWSYPASWSDAAGGDELAWESLVRRYLPRVYGVGIYYLHDPEEARDLAQNVFLRIYRRLDQCTNDETFVPWLIQVARNAAIDQLRRQRVRPAAIGVPVDELTTLRSPAPGPEEDLARNQRRTLVHRAMERLSRINREIIFLKEIQGMSLESIAATLKVPVGTIKSRASRARVELARVLVEMNRSAGGSAGPGVGS